MSGSEYGRPAVIVPQAPIRVGFVLHTMQVAGAEVLVAETIRRLGPRITPVVVCLDAVGQIGARMTAEGVPVVALGRAPGFDFTVARRLAAEVAAREIEIVHAHQYTPFFYTALARLLTRQRVHVMFTEHGRHFPDIVSPKRRLVNRFVLSRLADEVNGVCRFSTDSLARADGFGRRPMEVIENGIDLPRYDDAADKDALRVRLGLDPSRSYVACVARFHPVKDHATLLHAFARVASARPDVDLLLAGGGPLQDTLEELARSLGIRQRVHFLGIRDDVPDVLRASDVFSLTSVSEAASLTLLEAMGTGLPVVVTDVGGNPEIVADGETGFLVPRGDAGAVAAALMKLLADPATARSLGAAGRRRVEERFQLDRTIGTYYSRYAAAAARLRGRPTAEFACLAA
ncbi:MAG TPA: glycosyltransferase [Vicinamibacterales bacterium]|nr:glycosyltransferase [Vicinamibacterales bacterium]